MNINCDPYGGRTRSFRAWGMPGLLALLMAVFGLAHAASAEAVPQIDHIVVAVLENHSYAQIIGNEEAPFINNLAKSGALFVNSRGIRKPSQPNYLALYSGSTQGIKDDEEHTRTGPTLATALAQRGKSFVGYTEMPGQRKHLPWESFKDQASYGQDIARFPEQFDQLPHVSFVIPDDTNNMHDGSIRTADDWLKTHLGDYIKYCRQHRCLLIVTFDEPKGEVDESVPTIIAGLQVKTGIYAQPINHYSVLRTITDAMEITALGESTKAHPISEIWRAE